MERILLTTDFSAASRHALDFTASLLQERNEVILDLVHVHTVSVVATADALALAGIRDGVAHSGTLLDAELGYAQARWPALRISGHVIAGNFLDALRDEARELQPLFIVLGTAGFRDLYLGTADPLDALRELRYPVLFVPQGAAITPIREVAYACNYRFAGPRRTPIAAMKRWLDWTGARLRMIHTDKQARGEDPRQQEGEAWLREAFAAEAPDFEWIVDRDVIHGLSHYLTSRPADCLIAVPRRYGFWESLFHESRTKALARLNRIPVFAVPELES